MLKVVKVRIYPTQEQENALAKSMGCTRWLWNEFLSQNNKVYQETSKGLSRFDYQKQLPQLKKEYEWLGLAYSQCLQVVCLNLSRAFINFFEGRAKYPNFKSKHGRQSISYPQHVKIEGDYLKIPKVKNIFGKIHREVSGKLKTVTLSKNPDGKYYASLLFDDELPIHNPKHEGKAIGIDLGILDFCVTSDGSKYKNPKHFVKHQRNLKRKQQKLSRKQKGSNSRVKAKRLVARIHSKIARCREDFLHKLSRAAVATTGGTPATRCLKIVNENQVIALENLNVKGMVRNNNLAKAISDCGWGMFCTMLKYKAENEGKIYIEVNRFFPSSKTCNVCLNQVGS